MICLRNPILTLILFCCLLTFTCQAQDVNEILEKYYTKVSNGAISRWDEVKTIFSIGYGSFVNLSGSDPDFETMNYFKKYLALEDGEEIYQTFTDSSLDSLSSQFIFSSKGRKFKIGNLPEMANPISKVEFDEQRFRFMPLKVSALVKKSKKIQLTGVREREGGQFYEITLGSNQGPTHQLLFNTATYLLEYFHVLHDNSMTRFLNYRVVDGYLMYTKEVSSRNGVVYFWSTTSKIIFNPQKGRDLITSY